MVCELWMLSDLYLKQYYMAAITITIFHGIIWTSESLTSFARLWSWWEMEQRCTSGSDWNPLFLLCISNNGGMVPLVSGIELISLISSIAEFMLILEEVLIHWWTLWSQALFISRLWFQLFQIMWHTLKV